MKDIARDLGVSVVTVSKVLRNHSDIGNETRERVLQRIKELNYGSNYGFGMLNMAWAGAKPAREVCICQPVSGLYE